MKNGENKTGQHIDEQKRLVLIPSLVKKIMDGPNNNKPLSILDAGAGDGTSTLELVEQLMQNDVRVEQVTLTDCSHEVIPEMILHSALKLSDKPLSVSVVESVKKSSDVGWQLGNYEEQFNVALLSLVTHQIQNPALIKLYFCKILMALEDNGTCFISDLHQKYLRYLAQNFPEKFSLETNENGIFTFDSGGSADVYLHNRKALIQWAISAGFTFSSYSEPSIEPIKHLKGRYTTMIEEGIPLFYTIELVKDSSRFRQYSEGIVKKSNLSQDRLKITYRDNDIIEIPWLMDREVPEKGDKFIVLGTTSPDKAKHYFINAWVIPHNPDKQTRHLGLEATVVK